MTRAPLSMCLGASLAVLGCASPADPRPIEIVFDPCATRVVVAADTTPDEVRAVDEGLRLWNEAAGLTLSREGEGTAVEIQFMRTLPALFGSYDDRAGAILINRGIVDPDVRAVVVAHELGHAFGLLHAEGNEASLMSAGNTTVPPLSEDVNRLRALWGDCF